MSDNHNEKRVGIKKELFISILESKMSKSELLESYDKSIETSKSNLKKIPSAAMATAGKHIEGRIKTLQAEKAWVENNYDVVYNKLKTLPDSFYDNLPTEKSIDYLKSKGLEGNELGVINRIVKEISKIARVKEGSSKGSKNISRLAMEHIHEIMKKQKIIAVSSGGGKTDYVLYAWTKFGWLKEGETLIHTFAKSLLYKGNQNSVSINRAFNAVIEVVKAIIPQDGTRKYYRWNPDEMDSDGMPIPGWEEDKSISLLDDIVFTDCIYNIKTGERRFYDFNKTPIFGPCVIPVKSTDLIDAPRHYPHINQYFNLFKIPESAQNDMKQFMGVALTNRKVDKMLYLYGKSGTGKTSFINILQWLFFLNTVKADLDSMAKNDFQLATLLNANVAVLEEFSSLSKRGVDLLKRLVGGDSPMADIKFGTPVPLSKTIKYFATGNDMPRNFGDSRGAIERRLHIIPLNYRPPEDLIDTDVNNFNNYTAMERYNLMLEALHFAWEGLMMYKDNGFRFDLSEEYVNYTKGVLQDLTDLQDFIEEHFEFTAQYKVDRVLTQDLNKVFTDNERNIPDQRILFKVFSALGWTVKKATRCKGKKGAWKEGRGFSGIKIKKID